MARVAWALLLAAVARGWPNATRPGRSRSASDDRLGGPPNATRRLDVLDEIKARRAHASHARGGDGARAADAPRWPRPRGVAAVGAGPGGAILLFTHIRRAGGTVLEDQVLKPALKRLGLKPALCKEGDLARHHRGTAKQRAGWAAELASASLVWRHCPYGAHALLAAGRPYVYLAMLRAPAERMASWEAYCSKYSPGKCNTPAKLLKAAKAPAGGKGAPRPSDAAAFYAARRMAYEQGGGDTPRAAPKGKVFHENQLEYALDDNYQARVSRLALVWGGV